MADVSRKLISLSVAQRFQMDAIGGLRLRMDVTMPEQSDLGISGCSLSIWIKEAKMKSVTLFI